MAAVRGERAGEGSRGLSLKLNEIDLSLADKANAGYRRNGGNTAAPVTLSAAQMRRGRKQNEDMARAPIIKGCNDGA